MKINKYLVKHENSFAFVFDVETDFASVIFFNEDESKVVSFYHSTLGFQLKKHIHKDNYIYILINDKIFKDFMLKIVDRLLKESNGIVESIKNIPFTNQKNKKMIGSVFFPFVLKRINTEEMELNKIITEIYLQLKFRDVEFEYLENIKV